MIFSDFTYRGNFSGLTDAQVTAAIGIIEALYYGACFELWGPIPDPQRSNMRTQVENLLIAWYLANIYPEKVTGIDVNGSPLVSKSIGGTSVAFRDYDVQGGLENLMSNPFGQLAYQYIQNAPELKYVYG